MPDKTNMIAWVIAANFLSSCVSSPEILEMPDRYTLSAAGVPELSLSYVPALKNCRALARSVLYVHGATFPGELSVGFKLGETSWADDLNRVCFNVWALDFAGYGSSGRYDLSSRTGPVGRTEEAQKQITRAVDFLLDKEGTTRVSIIAHSWGTLPAGAFTAAHPEKIDKLILFGPIAQRNMAIPDQGLPPTQLITVKAQHDRFISDTPKDHPAVINDTHFAAWGQAFLASDPQSGRHTPPAVSVPTGPIVDIGAAWSGHFPYDLADIAVPTLIVRGEWDSLSTDADAAWLMNSLTGTPTKRDVKIPRGGHLMHLESARTGLYRAVGDFLQESD